MLVFFNTKANENGHDKIYLFHNIEFESEWINTIHSILEYA